MSSDEYISLRKMVSDLVDAKLIELHTTVPGIIEKFDAVKCVADVQIALKTKYIGDPNPKPLPILQNVPVQFPRGGGAVIEFDLQKGDPVTLHFAERSIEKWQKEGGIADPKDPRRHHISDAIAVPGVYPDTIPLANALIRMKFAKDGSLETKNEKGSWKFSADGGFQFKNEKLEMNFGADGKLKGLLSTTGVDFFPQLAAILDLIMQSNVATGIGIQPFIPAPTYAAERAKIDDFV